MKKTLFLIVLFVGSYFNANAQEQKKDSVSTTKKIHTIYIEGSAAVGTNLGLTYEYSSGNSIIFRKLKTTGVLKLYYMQGTLTSSSSYIKDIDGNGWGVEIGGKTFFNKHHYRGFYFANYLLFGSIEFDAENVYDTSIFGGDGKFYGKYKYFSFFSPEVGFKFLIAKTIAVNLHVGTAWLIEFKGKGDVDNKAFDNWVPRLGLSIGYQF